MVARTRVVSFYQRSAGMNGRAIQQICRTAFLDTLRQQTATTDNPDQLADCLAGVYLAASPQRDSLVQAVAVLAQARSATGGRQEWERPDAAGPAWDELAGYGDEAVHSGVTEGAS